MSININYVKTPPINIKISDKYKYQAVALLVDRHDFLEDIASIRNNLGITTLIPYEQVKNWQTKDIKEISIPLMSPQEKQSLKKQIILSNAVHKLKQKYQKGIHFTEIIKFAILAGVVTDKEYLLSTFYEAYPFPREFEDMEFDLEAPMIAIFVNRDTKVEEVTKLFKKEIPLEFEHLYRKQDKNKTFKSDLKTIRKWYWLNTSYPGYKKIGYQKIANMETSEGKQLISKDRVRQTIIRYKDQLKVNI